MLRKRALATMGLGLGLLAAFAFATGCGSGGSKNNNGTGGSGTSGASGSGTGGASGSGTGGSSGDGTSGAGTSGSSGSDGGTLAQACYPIPAGGLITDFTYTDGGALDSVTFGDFMTMFSGGEYAYPAPVPDADGGMIGLTSDVTQNNWHITGNVVLNGYSGWGLYTSVLVGGVSTGCTKIDASAFAGIQFTVQSNLAMPTSMTFGVGTAADDISADWLNANTVQTTPAANFGRCTPSGAPPGQYDGTCASPSTVITLTQSATPTTITVLWADLIGGRPDASVTPSEITGIFWAIPNSTYAVDIIIDDLQFIPL